MTTSAAPGSAATPASPAASSPSSITAYRPNPSRPASGNPSDAALEKLNGRLGALLPQGAPVSYSNKHFTNTLEAAVNAVKAEYYAAAAPPPSVLAKVIKIVRQRGALLDRASSIVYIIKRQRVFGLEICTGWKVETPEPGAKPQGGYTIGSCGGEEFEPPDGLPTAPPAR